MKFRVWAGVALFILLAFCGAAIAQELTGTIVGFVKDKTGAVLPNVTVTIRNNATGVERKVVSGGEGEYAAPQLSIGSYDVEIEHTGFKKYVAKAVKLQVGDKLRLDVTLEVGGATEAVTVEGAAVAVQTEDSTVGGVVTGAQVLNMPLNGRALYQLVALQPGVSAASGVSSGYVGVGLDALNSVFINGTRSSQNNWLVDGADNNDTGSNRGVITYLSVDSVAEFRVLRGNYSAEFGRSAGGQINVVTKSGGNQFHGSAFEFWRNNKLDARNYFKPDCDIERAAGRPSRDGVDCGASLLRYHNFGYAIGGPVKKDKLFFYWNQEFRRTRRVAAGVRLGKVPTDLNRAGNFTDVAGLILLDPLTNTQFPGNVIPANRLDANAVALLAVIPRANMAPNASAQNFQTSQVSMRDYREELIKIDYAPTEHHKIWGRYVQDKIPSTEPLGEIFGAGNFQTIFPNLASTATNIPSRGLAIEYNWMPSATLINNLAFNYSYGGILSHITAPLAKRSLAGFSVADIFPENTAGTLPAVSFGQGYSGWAGFQGPYDNTYGSKRVKDNLTWIKSTHTLRFGYLYSWEYKNENALGNNTYGSLNFPGITSSSYRSTGNAIGDFLLGRASSYSENDIDIASALRYDMHEAYFQDDWKVKSNFTLNLGVRWSYIRSPVDELNRLSNFIPSLFDPAKAYQIDASGNRIPGTGDPLNGIVVAGLNSPYGRHVVKDYWNTFGPRIGFAWDPQGNGKTAIRGGYGWYFDRVLSGIALQNAFVNPPFVTSASISSNEIAGCATPGASDANACTPTFSNVAGGAARNQESIVRSLTTMNPNFKVPTVQHWSLGIQRELFWAMTVDVAYVGNHGTHLLKPQLINQSKPGLASSVVALQQATYRGWGAITERATTAGSRYDSLQVGVTKRPTKGIQWGLAYTWSKTLSDSSSDRDAGDRAQDIRNPRAERALTGFDKTHVFVTNFTYDLPFFAHSGTALYNALGGWQVGGIWRAESGVPLTITTATNQANTFTPSAAGVSQRPNLIADPQGTKQFLAWFNTGAFAAAPTNTFGNAPKGVVRGPGLQLFDVVAYKNFKIPGREGMSLQIRGDFFNVFNHTNWSGVGTAFTTPTSFGKVTSALEPRQVQLGARFTF